MLDTVGGDGKPVTAEMISNSRLLGGRCGGVVGDFGVGVGRFVGV